MAFSPVDRPFEPVRLARTDRFNDEARRRSAAVHGSIIAYNSHVAFSRPRVPMCEARVAFATTAGARRKDQPDFDMTRHDGDASHRWISADTPSREIAFTHDHYDHTDADSDPNCMFPIEHLRTFAERGLIGSVASEHPSASGFLPDPREFLAVVAGDIVARLRSDEVDVVVLSGGCPNCMRTMALMQNILEHSGFATSSLMMQPMIADRVGTPRTGCVRMPNGNAFGVPGDPDLQQSILYDLLRLVWAADEPRTIVKLPYRWYQESSPKP